MSALPIVGADIVEVAPAYDHAEITAVAAANLAYELVTIMASGMSVTDRPLAGRASARRAAFTFDVDAESAVLWGAPQTPTG